MHPSEIWRPVVGWEDRYEVSCMGRVRSRRREGACYGRTGVIHAGKRTAFGHIVVQLRRPGVREEKRVHRLVLEAFFGPCPDGMEGCHNNGNPSDNRLENLRWDTRSENIRDSVRHGTHSKSARRECIRGHLLIAPNLVSWSRNRHGHRQCLACARARASLQKRPGDLGQRADEKYAAIMGHTADYLRLGHAQALADVPTEEAESRG